MVLQRFIPFVLFQTLQTSMGFTFSIQADFWRKALLGGRTIIQVDCIACIFDALRADPHKMDLHTKMRSNIYLVADATETSKCIPSDFQCCDKPAISNATQDMSYDKFTTEAEILKENLTESIPVQKNTSVSTLSKVIPPFTSNSSNTGF